MEAPAPFAPLAAEALALPRPSERCQRCGSLFPSDANFCARCGLARSTDGQSYQHPEKLPGFADVFSCFFLIFPWKSLHLLDHWFLGNPVQNLLEQAFVQHLGF